jgi:formylglycine-generating enzyme required for sulfatase activity
MFRQVVPVASALLTALVSLALAAAQEPKKAGGAGHIYPSPFQAPVESPEPGGNTKSPANELTVDLGGGVKLEMVLSPAGQFVMGSPDSDQKAQPAEKPHHPRFSRLPGSGGLLMPAQPMIPLRRPFGRSA